MKSMAAAGLAAALCLVAGSAFAGSCAPASAETDVPQTLTDLFAVARTDDEAGFRQLIAEDFYAYDNGKRFEGIALFQTLKGLHAAGRRFEWSVTEPRVTVVCDVAFVTYVNKGATGDAKAMQPMTWLESALLRYEQGRWRVAFLH